jgi:fibronectin type 3 domain-containing protein/lysophospholipase L1-like esterase
VNLLVGAGADAKRAPSRLTTVTALLIAVVVTIAVAAPPALAAEVSRVRPVRIMPLGDSLTFGVGASGGYRLELKDLMVPDRYSFDFVGPAAHGPYEIEDRQHSGWRGWRIDEIDAAVTDWLTTHRPDVVTLMIGTNDILQDYQLDSAPARLGGLIDKIVATSPDSAVLVASIPPIAPAELWSTTELDDEQIRTYNAEIPAIVSQRAAAGKNVSFVDVYPVVNMGDLIDGIHLDAFGYRRVAEEWRASLYALLDAPPAESVRTCPCSIWDVTDTPATPQVSSTTAREVGVRFRTERDGHVTGIRFYKGSQNTGTHKGRLWTRDGTMLASATFSNESASGWQEVTFNTPVPVRAFTTYVASYFAPVGRYASDAGYFNDVEAVSSPLRALATGQSGGNGWFSTSSTGGFPSTPANNGNNFWVDVVFTPSTSPNQPPPPPAAPTNVSATALSSSDVRLTWSDVGGEAGYRIQRAPAGTDSWATVGFASRDMLAHTDTGLTPSTSYDYRVVAASHYQDSAPSTVASVTTQAAPPSPPPTPSGLTAAGVSSERIDLSWQDVTGETGYRIERSPDGSTGWTSVGTTAADVTTHSDTGLTTETSYSYRVVATSPNGDSNPSNVATATTLAPPPPDPDPPTTPTGLDATAVSDSAIDLSWQDVTVETGYRIERTPAGTSDWAAIGTTAADVVTYDDTGLSASTAYSYRVVATSDQGDSAPSNVSTATTAAAADTEPPTAPSVLSAVIVKNRVDLSWTASDDPGGSGVAGYRVWRSSSGTTGTFAPIATTTATTFTDGGAARQTYWYQITAYDAAGNESVASNTVTTADVTPRPPDAPSDLIATTVSSAGIDLSWRDVTGEDGYRVERAPENTNSWTTVATTVADVTRYSDTGLSALTSYSYRVVATSPNGDSAPSNIATATTAAASPDNQAPTAPAGLQAAAGKRRVNLTWGGSTDTGGSGLAGYRVWRSSSGTTGTFVPLATTSDTAYTDAATTSGKTYWYHMTAYDNAGNESLRSNIVNAAPR